MVKIQIRLAELLAKKTEKESLQCQACGCRHFVRPRIIRRVDEYAWKVKACRHCGQEVKCVEREK